MSSPSPAQLAFSPERFLGTVLAAQANYYQVRLALPSDCWAQLTEANGSRLLLLCTRRTRLQKIGQQVMVGDQVLIERIDWPDQRGVITEVLPRKTQLDRPPIANVDQLLLVFAFSEPPLDAYQLSRFLVRAEVTGLQVDLCLNKADLVAVELQQQWQKRLQGWGYEPLLLSAYTGQGLAQLNRKLDQHVTVVAGPSGVGKSSLLNYLIPTAHARVDAVSAKLGRGRHTTRHVELFELPNGGLLADTPGFNQPDLDCTPEELGNCFPEIRQLTSSRTCQFKDCLHRDEPNCVVRGSWERYEHYLDFLNLVQQRRLRPANEVEPGVKLKTKQAGQLQYEPRLAIKKYRRPSRRSEHQALQDLYQDSQ